MTDYLARKMSGRCTYPKCDHPALPDNGECRLHRLKSLDRKRVWWTFRRHLRRPKQLCLGFDG